MSGLGPTQPAPTGDALLESAQSSYFAYREAISAVQLHLAPDDEPWMASGGDHPQSCDDSAGYRFNLLQHYPAGLEAGWRLPQSTTQTRNATIDWLTEQGWTVAAQRDLDGDIARSSLIAMNPEAGVSELMIDFIPGEAMDRIALSAVSACFAGSAYELSDLMFPMPRANPEFERPSDTPWFGTEDGTAPLPEE